MFDRLAREQSVKEDLVDQWLTRVNAAQVTRDEALAELERARLQYKSEINGVNTTVANVEAQLQQAQYYLDDPDGARGRPHGDEARAFGRDARWHIPPVAALHVTAAVEGKAAAARTSRGRRE